MDISADLFLKHLRVFQNSFQYTSPLLVFIFFIILLLESTGRKEVFEKSFQPRLSQPKPTNIQRELQPVASNNELDYSFVSVSSDRGSGNGNEESDVDFHVHDPKFFTRCEVGDRIPTNRLFFYLTKIEISYAFYKNFVRRILQKP